MSALEVSLFHGIELCKLTFFYLLTTYSYWHNFVKSQRYCACCFRE